VSSMEAFQRAAALPIQVEVSMASASAMTSNPDLVVGEECWKSNLEAMGTRNLHLVVTRIQLKVVVATWKVARLLEILPMTSASMSGSGDVEVVWPASVWSSGVVE
jgi:hypothetical protein